MNFWKELRKPIKILAPMEDVTDSVFRRIVANCGRPDVFFTEFTSTDGLFSPGRRNVRERLEYTKVEKPLVAQIWGNNPDNYFKACKEISSMGFDGIDINMGCPVNKIASKGCCSALIDNQSLAQELIQAAKEGAGRLPVSVKTRLGYKKIQTEEWFSFLLNLNLPVITVHGRVAKHQSKYPANWNEIAKVVKLKNEICPDTLIIGNGDVKDQNDITEKTKQYQVDGVMIGRGIFSNLFIFNEQDPKNMDQIEPTEKINLLHQHLDLFEERWGNSTRYATMKKFYKVYINNFPSASELRAKLMETHCIDEAKQLITDFHSDSTAN